MKLSKGRPMATGVDSLFRGETPRLPEGLQMKNPERTGQVEGGAKTPNADADASCARYDVAPEVNRTGTVPEAVEGFGFNAFYWRFPSNDSSNGFSKRRRWRQLQGMEGREKSSRTKHGSL